MESQGVLPWDSTRAAGGQVRSSSTRDRGRSSEATAAAATPPRQAIEHEHTLIAASQFDIISDA